MRVMRVCGIFSFFWGGESVAQEDGAIRIVTKITTKDAEESLDSLEYQIKKSAKYMDTLRQKMDALKGQKIPTREYKDLQAELARAEKELQKLVAQQEDWEKIGITSGGAWDTLSEEIEKADYKIDDIKAKMQSLTDAGKDFTLGEETFEYKGYERQLKYEEEAITKAGEHYKRLSSDEDKLSEIKKNSTVVDQKMIDSLEQRNQLAEKLKELEKAGVAEGYEEHNQAYIQWKNAADAVKAYRAELDKQTDYGQAKIAQQEAKAAERKEAAQRRAEEQAERALQKENARIQKQTENEAKLAAKEAERQAKIEAEAAEEERLSAIREKAVVGNQRMVDVMERRKQLAQEIADMERAGVGAGYQQHDAAKQELSELDREIKDYANGVEKAKESYGRLGQAAKKAFLIARSAIGKAGSGIKKFGGFVKSAFSGLHKSASKSTGVLGTLASRFKGLALSLLIFNQISKAFNAMISGMKEGFGNLYNEVGAFKSAVDGLKASSLTLKNSFAAAFRPLVEIAIPYIQRAIDAIANLMNIIGQFTAAITGQKTYTKAVKQTTAAIEGQTKAQNKQLSSLDRLNNLSSGGGGSVGGSGAGNMFEEAPIDGYFLDLANKVKDIFLQIFAPLKEAWSREGKFVMDSWKYALKEMGDLIKSIGSDFLEVWQQENTIKIFEDLLHIIGDIGLVAGNLAGNFRKAWNENETGKRILEGVRDTVGAISTNIRHAADVTAEWAKNIDFSPFLIKLQGWIESLVPVINALSGIVTDFYANVLLPLGKWTIEKGLPELLQIMTDFNNKVDWESIRERLSEFWEHLEPFAETIGEGLLIFIEKLSNVLANFINSPTFEEFLLTLENWMDNVSPEDIADGLGKICKAILGFKALSVAFSVISIGAGAISKLGSALKFFGIGGGAAAATSAMGASGEAALGMGGAFGVLPGILGKVVNSIGFFGVGIQSLKQVSKNAAMNEVFDSTCDALDELEQKYNDGVISMEEYKTEAEKLSRTSATQMMGRDIETK